MNWKTLAHEGNGARLAFAAIAVLALGLRLWHLELITFGYDEAVLLHFAEDMVRLGDVPLSGPLASIGLSTPAHFIYLIAPVVAVSRDPAFVAGFIALGGAGAVVITMVLGWRAFGPLAALVAGLLFAVNPLAVAYSRRIWQPDVLPLLTALLFLALDLAIVGRRVWWASAALPIAALATLVHSSIGPLLPFLLAPAAMLVLRRRWIHLAVGVGTSVLIAIPFVLYEFQTDWQDYPNFRYYSSLNTFVDSEALRWMLAVTTGWMLPNDGVIPAPQRVLPDQLIDAGAGLALGLLVAGLLVALVTIARGNSFSSGATRIRLVALVLWIALPVALSIRHWQPLFLHYYYEVLPAASLLMALVCTALITGPPLVTHVLRAAALSVTVAVATIQAISVVGGLQYQAAAVGGDPCFMTPLAVTRRIAAEVEQFGRASGSTAAAVELDAAAAKPMAYLLRPYFADVYLPQTRFLSQTPTLVGNVGLGSVTATAVPDSAATSQRAVMTASAQLGITYRNGITLHNARFSAESAIDQHLLLAINWSVDPAETSTGEVMWQLKLTNAAGQTVGTDAGDQRVPADLRGQRLVSWFWFDAPPRSGPRWPRPRPVSNGAPAHRYLGRSTRARPLHRPERRRRPDCPTAG